MPCSRCFFVLSFKLGQHQRIGRRPRAHHMHCPFPIGPIQGTPDDLPIQGHDVLGKVSQRAHPRRKSLLEPRRIASGKHPTKRIGRRNAMVQGQKLCKPRVVRISPLFDLPLVVGTAAGCQDRDGDNRLQRVERRGMLAARVMANRDIGKHLVDGVGGFHSSHAIETGTQVATCM